MSYNSYRYVLGYFEFRDIDKILVLIFDIVLIYVDWIVWIKKGK